MKTTVLLLTLVCTLTLAADNLAAPPAIANRKSSIVNSVDAITIPQMLSYQGKLTDTFGLPVADTTYSTNFRLYNVPSGGSPFWNETQVVRTRGGLFSVLLGSTTPIGSVPDAGAAYLGMAVAGGAEMTPRLRIASAAYAYLTARAANADLLQGRDTTTFSRSNHLHDATYVNEGQASSVTSTMITDATIAAADLNQMGAASGQVMKWTGSAWAPRNDSVGGGSGDNAWVRGTPDSVLYTVHRLGIARGEASNMLYGTFRQSHVNFGVSCTTGVSGQNYSNLTIGGGLGNTVGAAYSTVAGGLGNRAIGIGAAVAGGAGNAASGDYSSAVGGYGDTTLALCGGVLSGYLNKAGDAATDTCAVVAGGYGNRATGRYSFVGGGQYDTASGDWSTVGGGSHNEATGAASTVSGGSSNDADTSYATVSGGAVNKATGYAATVSGGYSNDASGQEATIGGGSNNTAIGTRATVCGGLSNSATAGYATIGGGSSNIATGARAVVGGGINNRAGADYATVSGGFQSAASGDYSTVAGGDLDTSYAASSFTTNSGSVVPSSFSNAAAFNGQRATASNQTRVGALSKASGTFTIDHPTDPSGRILNHYFIEGPEMLNIYRGSVVLDAAGRAEVSLPDYFDALNRNPMVQLTGVGTYEVHVSEDVSANRFAIGGRPGTKVYWQVTGERKDVSAEITRRLMPVEQPKTGVLAGTMLDDDFLRGAMDQLVREGKAQGIDFRTAAGRQRFEKMKRLTEHQ